MVRRDRVSPDDDRLNPYGGAIACGHPLAATGVRLMSQLAYGLRERKGRSASRRSASGWGWAPPSSGRTCSEHRVQAQPRRDEARPARARDDGQRFGSHEADRARTERLRVRGRRRSSNSSTATGSRWCSRASLTSSPQAPTSRSFRSCAHTRRPSPARASGTSSSAVSARCVPDRRGDQRRVPRRRCGNRTALLRADTLAGRSPLCLPRSLSRHLPRLGRHAADPATRRPRDAIRFDRQNPLRQNKLLDARQAFELGFAESLLEPVDSLTARSLSRSSSPRACAARTARAGSKIEEQIAAQRALASGRRRARRRTRAVFALDLIERAVQRQAARGRLPRRSGGDRRPDHLAGHAALALRLRPRRAAREEGRRDSRRQAAPDREGRCRRRRLDGDAARDPLPEAARRPAGHPRPRPGDRRPRRRRRSAPSSATAGARSRARPSLVVFAGSTSSSRPSSRRCRSSRRLRRSARGRRAWCILATNTSSLSVGGMGADSGSTSSIRSRSFR